MICPLIKGHETYKYKIWSGAMSDQVYNVGESLHIPKYMYIYNKITLHKNKSIVNFLV